MRSALKGISLTLGSLIFSLGLAACGDDGDGPNQDTRKVSSLTPAEQQQLCEQEIAAIPDEQKESIFKLVCTLQLVFTGECNPTAVDACADELAKTPDDADCDLDLDAAKCDVTVAELTTCRREALAASAEAIKNVTCENIFSLPQPSEPASCKIVKDKCPSALEDEEEEETP